MKNLLKITVAALSILASVQVEAACPAGTMKVALNNGGYECEGINRAIVIGNNPIVNPVAPYDPACPSWGCGYAPVSTLQPKNGYII